MGGGGEVGYSSPIVKAQVFLNTYAVDEVVYVLKGEQEFLDI